jgi:hypothetical protein
MLKKAILLVFILAMALTVSAGAQVLSVNSGDGNAPFFISGEKTLVMNGFDLNAFGIQRPAVIDKISIVVQTPVPGTPIDVIVYQDANGGSPIDATVAGREQVTIGAAGTFTTTLATPITVTQPVAWIGFYLPVDFVFSADTSGTSVLTYWAWTPNSTFDLNVLSSAQVFGPADGTAPVNINLGGKARITAEITGAGGGSVTPIPGQENPNLGVMQPYGLCLEVSYDTADEFSSYQNAINLHCKEVPTWQSPAAPTGYIQRGKLYDIVAFKDNGFVEQELLIRVTHCIRPPAEDIVRAVIGSAYGSPRQWHILTTQRFGDVVCAEVRHSGNLSYFTH